MIPYQKLFDFDGLEKKIGSLDAEYQKFVTNTDNGSNIVKTAIASYTKDLSELLRELKSLNTAQAGTNKKFEEQSQKAEEYSKRITELRGIIATLTDAQAANEVSISKLKGSLNLLKKEYDDLDPKAADFKQQQQQIAEKVKLVKTAIDAQNTTLKAANQTLGSTVNSYARLSKETNELRTRLKGLDGAFDANTGKINKNNREAVLLLRTIQQNDAVLKRMDASMGVYNRNVGNYGSAWRSAKGDLLAFAGITTVVDTTLRALAAAGETISTFERYRSVIRFASENTANFNRNLEFLSRLADRTGMDIEVLYSKFGSFAIAGKAANMTATETIKLFQSIVKAGAAYKMSNDAISLSLKAVEQIMNKNKLSMEEISQQLGDHMPGALGLFAQGLGVTTEKLVDMIKKGELFAKETLPKFAENLEKTVGKQAQDNVYTISGAWNRMTNEVKLFIDQLGQDTKVSQFFSAALNGTTAWFAALREAVNSNEWADFVAVLLGNPSAMRRLTKSRTDSEFKQIGDMAEREGIAAYFKKLTQAQRNLIIEEKQRQFHILATAATSSQAKAREAQESLRLLNIYKEINKELSLPANKSPKKEPKDKTPKATKEESNAYEKVIKAVGENMDKTINEIDKNLKKGKVTLPKETLDSWKDLYEYAEKLANKIGQDLPDNIVKFNNAINPYQQKKPNGKVLTMQQLLEEVMKGEHINPLEATNSADMSNSMNAYISLVEKQGFEALKLQASFSRSLRGLKKSERDELIQLQQEIFDAQKAGNEKMEASAKARFDAEMQRLLAERDMRRQITDEAFNLASTLEKGVFEVQTAYRNNQIAQLEKQKENELRLAGDNAEAKEAIEQRMAEKIKDIRIKQAKADRQAALFNIALSTAQAVMAVLRTGGGTYYTDLGVSAGLLTALVAANGLAQAAIVLSTPLPEFKKGTRYAPEGPALVAEEGAELHESQGRYYLHEKPSIVPLKRGDKIFTAAETSRMLADEYKSQELNTIATRSKINAAEAKKIQISTHQAVVNAHILNAERIAQKVMEGSQLVAKSINNLPQSIPKTDFILDDEGFKEIVRRDNSVMTYRNRRRSI